MKPNKIRVVDLLAIIGRLTYVEIIDSVTDHVILEYYTSAVDKPTIDDVPETLLAETVTNIKYEENDLITIYIH